MAVQQYMDEHFSHAIRMNHFRVDSATLQARLQYPSNKDDAFAFFIEHHAPCSGNLAMTDRATSPGSIRSRRAFNQAISLALDVPST
jgi:hypothetical protein